MKKRLVWEHTGDGLPTKTTGFLFAYLLQGLHLTASGNLVPPETSAAAWWHNGCSDPPLAILRRVQGMRGHVPCSFLTSKRSKRVCCAVKETPWPALLSCAQKQSVGGRNCEPLCLRVAAGRRAPGCSKEPMRTMH